MSAVDFAHHREVAQASPQNFLEQIIAIKRCALVGWIFWLSQHETANLIKYADTFELPQTSLKARHWAGHLLEEQDPAIQFGPFGRAGGCDQGVQIERHDRSRHFALVQDPPALLRLPFAR